MLVKPFALVRVAHGAIEKADDIKNNTTDTNVQSLMDNVETAGKDAIAAAAKGDLSSALNAKKEVEDLDKDAIAKVSPELEFIVRALEEALREYVAAAGIDLEILKELQQEYPDIASQVGGNVELPKVTQDDLQNAAVEAAQVGDVGEAKALADLATLVGQLTSSSSSGSGTTSSSGTSSTSSGTSSGSA